MSSAEFDLSAFEDPAPSSLSKGQLEASLPVPKDTVPVPRQRLALKADIQLEGNKYKGRRVSRSDVELDHETLGLLNDSDSGKEPNNGTSDASESELDESDDNRSVDNGQSTSDDVFDISSIPDDASDVGQKRKKNQLETQERKVAKRLANAEAKEAIRAAAIRNQKVSLYFFLRFAVSCLAHDEFTCRARLLSPIT